MCYNFLNRDDENDKSDDDEEESRIDFSVNSAARERQRLRDNFMAAEHGEMKKMKNENCTILIPKGNSYCRHKSSARGPRFKVSSEGLSAEIDIPQRSPIQVQTKVKVA